MRSERRLRRNGGCLVHIVGPDGTGKTTLAAALQEQLAESRPAVRYYWRPGVLPSPGELVGKPPPGPVTEPHRQRPQPLLRGAARLLYYAVDFTIGFWLRYYPVLRRGGVVVVERGWQDIVVDPRRYLLRGTRLARSLAHFIPGTRPDLLVVLEAPAEIVWSRKSELSKEEIDRQMNAWRFEARARHVVERLDARLAPKELAGRVVAAIGRQQVIPSSQLTPLHEGKSCAP